MEEGEHRIKRFLRRQGLFMGYLMAILRDLDAALEVFQNAAVVVMETAEKEPIRDFDAWAKEVVRRQALQYLHEKKRHAKKRRPISAELEDGLWLVVQEDRTVDEALSEERKELQKCVQKLPEKWRGMFALRYERHSSFEEIGSAVGATASAVQRTLSRIRKVLHDCVHLKVMTIEES